MTAPVPTRPGVHTYLLPILVLGLAALGFWYWQTQRPVAPPVKVITSEGVLARIQALNNLETVAYYVETVVQTSREGQWYLLWQDGQRGLFIAKGQVRAGLNLSKLSAQQVQVSPDGKQVRIQLPPAQVLSMGLDTIQTYDLKTGMGNLVPVDRQIIDAAQPAARQQMLRTACASGILRVATDNARQQMQALFSVLPDVQVQVTAAPVPTTCA